MSDVKISQLPATTGLDGTELVPLVDGGVDGGVTMRATATEVATPAINAHKVDPAAHSGTYVAGPTLTSFGAAGDGVADDTAAIQAAFNTGLRFVGVPGQTYRVTNILNPKNGSQADFMGATIAPDFDALGGVSDVFLFLGGATSGAAASNSSVKNVRIIGTGEAKVRFGAQVYGLGQTVAPTNVLLEAVETIGCTSGGIFLNKCSKIRVVRCKNDGGTRHVGVGGTLNFTDTTDVTVRDCETVNTTSFGYQSYYGQYIRFINNTADGTLAVNGDESCITVDRSKDVVVAHNQLANAPTQQIYVTGAVGVTVAGNDTKGGEYGIQVAYNFEDVEDAAIREATDVTVSANVCQGHTVSDIILNGVQRCSVVGNTMRGTVKSLQVQDQVRSGDSVQMNTTDITIAGNVGADEVNFGISSPSASPRTIHLVGNRFTAWNGLQTLFMIMDLMPITGSKEMRLGHAQWSELGPFKYTSIVATGSTTDNVARELRLASEASNHGMLERYDVGRMIWTDAVAAADVLKLHVGHSDGDRGFEVLTAGGALWLASPDGTRYKITAANGGRLAIGGASITDGDVLTTGEGTAPREIVTTTRSLSNQNMFLRYFTARKTETITQIRVNNVTAAGATPTLVRFGVWTADAAGALVAQVAATTNDTALLAGNNTDYTKAFAASFSKTAGVRYAVGMLVVTGASAPAVSGEGGVGAGGEHGQSPRIGGYVSGQADLPSTVVSGSISGTATRPYAVLLP